MAELGETVRTGPTTPNLTPAGAGRSPSSASPYSESTAHVTWSNADASDLGVTLLQETRQPFRSLIQNNEADLGPTQLPTTNLAVSGSAGVVPYFKMRGMDQLVNGLYETWIVVGGPDFSGLNYSGGLALPLRDIVIAASWTR